MGMVKDAVRSVWPMSQRRFFVARGQYVPLPIVVVTDFPLYARIIPTVIAVLYVLGALFVAWRYADAPSRFW